MALSKKATTDLIRVAAAGGSLQIVCGKATSDLIRIAAAVSSGGGHLTVTGAGGRAVTDLIRIAAAAPGQVTFTD
jgi:hypothetical protein